MGAWARADPSGEGGAGKGSVGRGGAGESGGDEGADDSGGESQVEGDGVGQGPTRSSCASRAGHCSRKLMHEVHRQALGSARERGEYAASRRVHSMRCAAPTSASCSQLGSMIKAGAPNTRTWTSSASACEKRGKGGASEKEGGCSASSFLLLACISYWLEEEGGGPTVTMR